MALNSQVETLRLTADEMLALCRSALKHNGFDDANAEAVADNVVACEMQGSAGHGLIRIPNYIRAVASGRINPKAKPIVSEGTASQLIVDGDNGFATLPVLVSRADVIRKARENGVVVVSLRNTHHMHALWWDLEPLAEQGLAALETVSTRHALAIYESHKPVVGTNPLAVSFPREGGIPITIDMASSKVARGDIRLAIHAGIPVPLGWGLDESGAPTDDPSRILRGGAQLPFSSNPKASNIALLVELLSTALSGDRYSFEAARDDEINDDGPWRTGAGILVLDPVRLGMTDYLKRTAELANYLLEMGCQRLPGSRRQEHLAKNQMAGVDVSAAVVLEIKQLAGGTK